MTRLLIADDSALMRKLLAEIFRAEGDFEIALARNGAEVLDLAATFRPDVVTLDVNMPVMDGLTCLSRLMIEAPCPVVMVSSLTRSAAEATLEALDLGAVDYVAKPEGTVSLSIDRIRPVLVEKVRQAAKVRLRKALRLKERVRHQIGSVENRSPRDAVPVPTVQRPRTSAARPQANAGEPDGLVLIGASTGGPQALETILSGLPEDLPWPVLIAQHMPATFTGIFAQRLDRLCRLAVVEVDRPRPLEPACAYVARGDADMVVARRPSGLIVLPVPASPSFVWHPSVDRLAQSTLQHLGASRLLGVLLTGMGNDGAQSLARIAAEGGRTIAEAEETAVVWGMPGELTRRGGAGQVIPLQDIAAAIIREVMPHAAGQKRP
ncbi:chemotaxis-specific protein-glutamate methyltransferase CheB [Arenibaculum pallidiluteum]|uniref:chemotaxis-specific protein-glutamate methyltransferase CheB n=1 Tax=Arenibaculum pallidiluteum TaxID=2812559 RepID=UPI001A979971|nr:chemotaxis-specific protein-glutamate methyltransferase CheB [Arenibaculum pallidiluteum]